MFVHVHIVTYIVLSRNTTSKKNVEKQKSGSGKNSPKRGNSGSKGGSGGYGNKDLSQDVNKSKKQMSGTKNGKGNLNETVATLISNSGGENSGEDNSGEDNSGEDNSGEDNFMDEFNMFEKMFQGDYLEKENANENENGNGNGNNYAGKDNGEVNKMYEDYNKMKPNANDYQYMDSDDMNYSYDGDGDGDGYGDDSSDSSGDDDLTNIWNKNMQNFEPSTLLTFEIAGNSEEYLFEDIKKINTYFRGVFYSNNESDDNEIEFVITDPDGNIVHKKEANEGIFYFYTKKIGIYTITLKNNKWMGKKLTTVALGLGDNPSLKSDHVKDFTNYIEKIVSETKKLKNEIKYLSSKHMIHIEKMKKITNKAFLYCFIKLFVLIFLSLFTIYYIKKLVSNKRVL
ncbi:hypothetical protein, conserved [Plasmodium ovale curtisi]|uniref:GOLD domain-containing protein n=1 Tax=Plasmodium ovale curtisi TaxID=864141 RepID=A0A1A8VSI4_PLAOA|nr:hypothetical protein, conserved [Plasmodium ovale curtisi]